MRKKLTTQISLFDPDPVHHSVGATLETISAWLDDHSELLDAIIAMGQTPRPMDALPPSHNPACLLRLNPLTGG